MAVGSEVTEREKQIRKQDGWAKFTGTGIQERLGFWLEWSELGSQGCEEIGDEATYGQCNLMNLLKKNYDQTHFSLIRQQIMACKRTRIISQQQPCNVCTVLSSELVTVEKKIKEQFRTGNHISFDSQRHLKPLLWEWTTS